MSNMSYCRFENTSTDLLDCYHNLFDLELSDSEKNARGWVIRLAARILNELEIEDPNNPDKIDAVIESLDRAEEE